MDSARPVTAANTISAETLKRRSGKSELELLLLEQIRRAGLPEPVQQHRFATDIGRNWAFDFAWPGQHRLAVEVDGGTWTRGRHTSGAGFQGDCDKTNQAQIMGWLVLRFTGADVREHRAVATIERALGARGRG